MLDVRCYSMNDLITIVDENDKAIGTAPRREAHEKGLWHRIVVIHVFNSGGQIYIQKRSPNSDTAPNLWDHSAAGHVDANEASVDAAKRELNEELGIRVEKITFIATYKRQTTSDNKILNRYWYIYSAVYDGEIQLQEEEITEGKFVDLDWLKKDIETQPDIYTGGFKKSLSVYLESTK